jgi:hypothetical protein
MPTVPSGGGDLARVWLAVPSKNASKGKARRALGLRPRGPKV